MGVEAVEFVRSCGLDPADVVGWDWDERWPEWVRFELVDEDDHHTYQNVRPPTEPGALSVNLRPPP
jgi:hypothetical protein